jgi:phage tail sheath gpL-like
MNVINPDLPSSWVVPGIYLSLDLTGSTSGLSNIAKRILLVGHKTPAGIAQPNTVVPLGGQGAGNLWFGRGSDVARMLAAGLSQIGGGTADFYGVAVPEPVGGVQSNHLITFVGTAQGSGAVDVFVCGYRATVPIANRDTPAILARNAAKALNAISDLPVTASAADGTVWLTYRARGELGNDLPVIVNFAGSTGMKASPGTLTFTGAAAGAGSATVTIAATTVPVAVADGETAASVAAKVTAELNSDAYPCFAEASGATVTLYYAEDRVVHRISAHIFTSTGLTVTAAVGTLGSGRPSLTAALGNIAGQAGFPCWVSALADVDSLGAMSSHIEVQGNGRIQKDQQLFVVSTEALPDAGAIPVGTTPTLSSSPRYAVSWCQDSPQQGYELAAREAARVCVEDYHPYNYDGEPLVTQGSVPLLLPHRNSRPGLDEVNAAIRSYYLTPLVVDEQASRLVICRDRTTSSSDDERLWAWGTIRTLAFYRYDLNQFLRGRFSKKNLKLHGTPRTPRTITLASIADAVYERIRFWDNTDLFDGADDLKKQIRVSPNPQVTGRVDIFVPCRPPVKLDQLAGVAGLI